MLFFFDKSWKNNRKIFTTLTPYKIPSNLTQMAAFDLILNEDI